MMEFAPSIDKKRHLYGSLHNGSHTSLYNSHHNNSSHSLHTKPSGYVPNIEKQLQSLLVEEEDTQDDTVELLQQTFAQLEVELSTPSLGSLSSTEKSTPYKSSQLLEGEGNAGKDFSAFTSPFSERPVVTGTYSYYIPVPTSVRSYLDSPDANILKNMSLPYPFRQRGGRHLEKEHSSKHKRPYSRRHSLDMGQVEGLIKLMDDGKAHQPPAALSQQTFQNIISWIPDKNMEWEAEVLELVHPLDNKK